MRKFNLASFSKKSALFNLRHIDISDPGPKTSYDPELLYVECRSCGKPVMWSPGETTRLLKQANVELSILDARCLILADSCIACNPVADGYTLAMVRLSGMTPQEFLFLISPNGGRA